MIQGGHLLGDAIVYVSGKGASSNTVVNSMKVGRSAKADLPDHTSDDALRSAAITLLIESLA
jgi:hypothetical protein